MAKYRVHGNVSIGVSMLVEADTESEALDKAHMDFPGLTNFCGNGGSDQLVGVYDSDISLDAGWGEAEFTEVEIEE
jgi:hypothetical protein